MNGKNIRVSKELQNQHENNERQFRRDSLLPSRFPFSFFVSGTHLIQRVNIGSSSLHILRKLVSVVVGDFHSQGGQITGDDLQREGKVSDANFTSRTNREEEETNSTDGSHSYDTESETDLRSAGEGYKEEGGE